MLVLFSYQNRFVMIQQNSKHHNTEQHQEPLLMWSVPKPNNLSSNQKQWAAWVCKTHNCVSVSLLSSWHSKNLFNVHLNQETVLKAPYSFIHFKISANARKSDAKMFLGYHSENSWIIMDLNNSLGSLVGTVGSGGFTDKKISEDANWSVIFC